MGYTAIVARKVLVDSVTPLFAGQVVVDTATGKIAAVLKEGETYSGDVSETVELDEDEVLMPGVVDAHVHLNEPGRTEWEGFATGTAAAAAGGCTTVVDMPLNAIPPTTTVANFEQKLAAAQGQCSIDVAFWGGVIPGNAANLKPLVARGVKGFKCFLIESGVEEFPCVTEQDLRPAMDALAGTGSLLQFHAEMEGCACASNHLSSTAVPDAYYTFLQSRPQSLELNAIELIVKLTREYYQQGKPVRTHIVHLSAADALPLIRQAKKEGLPLTVETCFHYLLFSAESIPNGATHFKCCPPIREDTNRKLLWEALMDGTIDYVVSDHSPCTPDLKRQHIDADFMKAWGGISGVQFGLTTLWTVGQTLGCTLHDITRWLSEKPAQNTQLFDRKGSLHVGKDADFVIFRPDEEYVVSQESLRFKNKLSPYVGRQMKGRVVRTIIRGHTVYDLQSNVTANVVGQTIEQ
ncbi:hypothetical protein BZG36_01152 [Bifiguratus adelaidae]|uniref:allantoinase n=1 Tax=Bifiguratus adelaidae TaxID=1938954 RepID=A0A261Y5Y8_9FUNG|nr:hypothetical protein BZG36_01152 [Bifiguratus adelaidae]